MSGEIVNFGKYKGQPLEILLKDKGYCDWLRTRPDFKDRYPIVFNFIISAFPEPQNSKEHNKMQIKFLDDEYALKLAYLLYPGLFYWNPLQINKQISEVLSRARENDAKVNSNSREDSVKTHVADIDNKRMITISNRNIESGHDVSYFALYGVPKMAHAVKIQVEIKPVVGDDYPAVLRQMKHMPSAQIHGYDFAESFRCLLLREYDGEGVTKEQFVKLFETQGFKVVFESYLDNVRLPLFDEVFKYEMI